MATGLCLFEDQFQNFFPLTYFRPVYDLRFGAFTLKEKIIRLFPNLKLILQTRDYLEKYLKEQNPGAAVNEFLGERIIFVNGRALLDKKAARIIATAPAGTGFYEGDFLVAVVLEGEKISRHKKTLKKNFSDFLQFLVNSKKRLKVKRVDYIWDLISQNGAEIEKDFKFFLPTRTGRKLPEVHQFNKSGIWLGKNLRINPRVVLDAQKGPVIIESGVKIGAFSVIEGPVFIGRGVTIKPNSYIYDGTSIGPFSKVSGEIEASIIQGFSNKQHEGFLGHSYIGEWVNLGAGTTTSDLKNNYGPVKVILNGRKINTGLMFLGAIIGDHTKTAINTALTTGTIAGVFANIFEAPPPKEIPAFSWGGVSRKKFKLEKALELAATVMKRRQKICSPAYCEIIRLLKRDSYLLGTGAHIKNQAKSRCP
jgi:UDP-N-acetylglucosamine diphosphorylase/glucosamine-1-phosphate N-acetyltransferase